MNLLGEKINKLEVGQRGFDPQDLFKNIRMLNTVLCWGSNNWSFHKDKWLKFTVQGYLFNGHVYITLGWDDTFTIYFTTSHGTIKEIKEGIYVDVLIETIDRVVETKL
jgi:hypothetical protein